MIRKSLFDTALEDIQSFALIFMPLNWGICLIVSLVLYFTLGSSVAFGYGLGSITSFLTFGLHMKSVKAFDEKVDKPRHKAIFDMGLRLLISGVMLYIALKDVRFNFAATCIGLLVIKVVLVLFVLVQSKLKNSGKVNKPVHEQKEIEEVSENETDLIDEVKEDEHA